MIYKPTRIEMDRIIQDVAGEIASRMRRWKYLAEQMATLTDQDLAALGYSATEIAYIRSFQSALVNIELRYRNQPPSNADDPSYFIGQMARLLIF